MPRKEKTNAKTWERDRRNRMNTYFKTLSDLLPPQQEGRKRNKVDILIHASKYIKELNNRTDELFSTHTSDAHKDELNRLKKFVTQLLSRTQLLSALLRDAGISVPVEPTLEKMSPLKWCNKINVEESDKYVDRLSERKKPDKRKSKQIGYKVPSKQKIVGLVNDTPKKVPDAKEILDCDLIEDQENHVNSSVNETCETRDAAAGGSDETEESAAALQHDATAPPLETAVSKPSKRIRKLESRKKVKRKGKIIDSKMKKKKIHVASSQSQSIANLLPGTLIWSAGKIVPLVTPITSLTPNILVSAQAQSSNPIILGNAQQNQMIVMQSLTNRVQSSVLPVRNDTLVKAVQKVALNGVTSVQTSLGMNSRDWSMKNIIEATKISGRKVILPKSKEITTTTMTYKVPIPAIHREPPTSKLVESIDHQSSRKSKKIVKNKKPQKSENPEAEFKESLDKNGATSYKVDEVETTKLPEESSSPGVSASAEIIEKKRKANQDPSLPEVQPAKIAKVARSPPLPCKSTENLKNLVEISAESTSEITDKTKKPESYRAADDSNESRISLNKSPAMPECISETESANVSQSQGSVTSKPSASELENSTKNSEDPETMRPPTESKSTNDWSQKLDNRMLKEPTDNDSSTANEPTWKSSANTENVETAALLEVNGRIAEAVVVSEKDKNVCDLRTRFDSLLRATESTDAKIDENGIAESAKIILNLDTNTTTTMKPEACATSVETLNTSVSGAVLTSTADIVVDEARMNDRTKADETLKSLSYSSVNSFVPIGNNRADGLHSDLSNDLFASLQVPSSSHNPESISPTAAFLMAFPLVSSLNGKTEVLEEEMKEDLKYHSQTPPMLLQIGAIEPNSFKVKNDSPTASALPVPDKTNSHQESQNAKILHRSTSEVSKALPKIINNETIKEPLFKVVLYPETSLVSSENFAPVPSNARPSDSVNTTLANGDIQTTSITEASNVATTVSVAESSLATVTEGVAEKGDVSARKSNAQQSGNVSLIAKYEETNSERTIVSSNCTSDSSKYETAGRYPTLPDYVPSYTNFPTSSSQQSRPNYGASKNAMVNTSGNSTQMAGLESATMAYPSMIRSQAVQSAYVAHTTGKEVVESMYPNHRRKDALLVNPPEAVTSYVAFPSVSQSLQHDYLSRSKETYQSYDIHGKENNAAAPFQGYSVASGKSSSIHDTSQQERTYVASRINDNVKEPLNAFHSYPTLAQSSKESTGQRANTETSGRLNSRESQRPVEASSRSSSNGKIDNFAQSASYSSFLKDSKNDILSAETMFQQAKRNESQNYVTYIREAKKTIYDPSANSSIPQTSKSQIIANSTIPRYGANQLHAQLQQQQQQQQQQQACVVTSNYAPSTTTSDNTVKSTTTVAHNSSNFSILSWTTFSPIGASSLNNNTAVNSGNANNHAHYEPGADHASEPTGPKTCCENYAYAPIHKDSSYSNILPSEGFNGDSTLVEKPRDKSINVNQKPAPQIFEDSAKAKNVQSIPTEHKIVRSHNQTATTTADYKYVGENKSNKPNNKYPMGSAYTQTEFASLEPQQTTKAPQPITGKPEKSNYPMPTYDSQASFDIAENNVTIKCSNNSEIYSSSSYKYIEDKDASLQLKYQPRAQTQATILHHDGTSYSGVKHVNQQQAQQPQQQQSISNKSKTIEQQQQQQPQQQHQQQQQQQQQQLQQQQQQPVRPPVNWMMTPEIKHSTNIADLILPPIGKELEFCQNNIFAQPSTYNQTASNHQFYNNYDTTVSAPHGFPNIPALQTDPRRIPDGFYTEEQAFSWSPTKASQIEHNSMQKSIDQHVVVPSTLPTLVGDLALGTNISEKQSFLFGQMAPPRANKDMIQTPASNAQNSQQSVQGSSFLSVSQLVENEKAEKSHQQQNHHSHNPNNHHHHHPQQQHQQQSSHQTSQQQARKHQRKNVAASPRATGKRQIEARKPTAAPSVVVDQLHGQTTEEQKLPTSHPFPEQQAYHHHHHHHHQQHQQQQQHQHSLQTQKFQQNDVHWRNRQCKSNYTAEALIGGNTSIHDNNNSEKQMQASTIKSFTSEYPQNKYPAGLGTTEMIMPTINYLSNPSDDQNSYGQTVNQNFNPSSYAYSPNTNIYPTTNFITSISNTSTSYMMPSLHENPSDFIEANSFLLPNVTSSSTKTTLNVSPTTSSTATSTRLVTSSSLSATANSKNQQQQYSSSSSSTSNLAKNQNCEKRNSYASTSSKKSKRKTDNGGMHNLEFPISTVGTSQIDDYHAHPHHHHHHHSHPSSFLAPPHANPLYQNHSHTSSSVGLMANSNRIARTGILSNNPSLGHHHPSGTSLTNFNLSTIFPEINDKVTGYKPSNVIPPGLSQASNHPTVTYPQRGNYATADTLGHVAQEPSQFTSDLPAAPPPGVLHYKTT